MSFLQLVLSLDKTIKEIILFWRICQFDRYRNRLFINWLVNVVETFTDILKYYFLQTNAAKIVKCILKKLP